MRTHSSSGFNSIPENVAAVVFSHLGKDPKDRIRLAAVSKVWRDAEKGGVVSLPGTPSELSELGQEFRSAHKHGKAIYWFEKSADHGDPEGMFWFASYTFAGYTGGACTEENYNKAVHWWKRASELGHAEATRMVALSYEHGDGVEIDGSKAIEWHVKAAELGNALAAGWLGNAHYYGLDGLTPNTKEALKWFRLALELGDANAREPWWEVSRINAHVLEAELAAA